MEYILVACFHVDRGPIMEHQFPGSITGDENMLAELMLPDQAHARKEDWTVFFLHKDASEADGETGGTEASKIGIEGNVPGKDALTVADTEGVLGPDGGEDEEEMEGGEGPPLIYVLNLVNTKYDPTAKRCVWSRGVISALTGC